MDQRSVNYAEGVRIVLRLFDCCRESCGKCDIGCFLFAECGQLDLGMGAEFLDQAHGPGEIVCISVQLIAMRDVFKFCINVVENACGGNFKTDEKRYVFRILSVFRLDGVWSLEVFSITGGDKGDFTVEAEILLKVVAGACCCTVGGLGRVLDDIKGVHAVSGADFCITKLECFFEADVTRVELGIVSAEQGVECRNAFFQNQRR